MTRANAAGAGPLRAQPLSSLPLFARYPELKSTLPWVPLAPGPSPVRRLHSLERRLGPGGEIWLKHDGLYGTVYGGNKPRKLEFVLADALERGARTVVTTGALGTNHGLATALYGARLGLRVVLLLTYQLPTEHVARRLAQMKAAGARVHYLRNGALAGLLAPYFLLCYAWSDGGRLPYLLPPGGSSPLGCLGYVNAALELAQQVREGQLPRPAAILLPVGTGGTAAGLLLGLRMANLPVPIVGVSVIRSPTTWPRAVAALARRTAGLLLRRGLRSPPPLPSPADVRVLDRWLGAGYGQPTRKGERALHLLAEAEGLALEPSYTAKAAAALIDLRQRGELPPGPLLYWHTHDAIFDARRRRPRAGGEKPHTKRLLYRTDTPPPAP